MREEIEGNQVLKTINLKHLGLAGGLLFLCITTAVGQTQGDGSRQIVLEEFTRARAPGPTAPGKNSTAKSTTTKQRTGVSVRLSHYRRVTRPLSSTTKSVRLPQTEIGITIWRLRPSRPEDEAGARLLVMKNDENTQWTPERIEADTPLKIGDRVRISIEAPRAGYLYVVDREQYVDGSLGDAFLIFPTNRTRGGDNRALPGKLIDIPSQEDNPNHFTLVPSPSRHDQAGEVLSIILTPKQLPFAIADQPRMIPGADISQWEKLWGAEFERFEMEGGAGLTWTPEEREASAARNSRYLTQDQPTPQTIYRLASTGLRPILVTLRLNYRNR